MQARRGGRPGESLPTAPGPLGKTGWAEAGLFLLQTGGCPGLLRDGGLAAPGMTPRVRAVSRSPGVL